MAGPVILDGDRLAALWRQDLARRAAGLRRRGVVARMAVVLVGDNPASAAYVARKLADCEETGIEAEVIRLSAAAPEAEVRAEVHRLNDDPRVQGCLVQFPLPAGHDEAAAAEAVAPAKDIDGLHPLNLGRPVAGGGGPVPCTPAAVLALLRHHGVALAGRHVVILGRGRLVGRPLGLLLSAPGVDATVSLLHSRTADPGAITRSADVVIAAAGVPDLVTASMLRPGAAVVGVGISYRDGAMVSDIAADVATVAGHVTPPHGSVGALTRAALLDNLLGAAATAAGIEGTPDRRAGAHHNR